MDKTVKEINSLLVDIFNDVMSIEKETLKKGPFSDLSITEMHVLEAIGKKSRTMTEVACDLGITIGTLTTSVNRLVKKEYVLRVRSEEDRRYVQISLSKKGKLAYRIHEAFHEKMVKAVIEGMSEEDYRVLAEGLNKLNQYFKSHYMVSQE